jgi:hypothetical protein
MLDLGSAVVKLQKYRHANFVGMCTQHNIAEWPLVRWLRCEQAMADFKARWSIL